MSKILWKCISDYPDYEVSSCGRVRRITPRRGRGKAILPDKIPYELSPGHTKQGYLVFTLCNHGKKRQFKAHRLVASAFLGPQPDEYRWMVAHKDDNPANNKLENLYWATPKENCSDRTMNGRTTRGVKCHTAKLNRKLADEIRASAAAMNRRRGCVRQLADKYGVERHTISDILDNRRWV